MAGAVLDPDSDLSEVQLVSGMDELKRRLEVLLGAKPEADQDKSLRRQVETDTLARAERKTRVAEAGGQRLTSAFQFLGKMLPASTAPASETLAALRNGLEQCAEPTADGSFNLSVKLPNAEALNTMAAALARLLAGQ